MTIQIRSELSLMVAIVLTWAVTSAVATSSTSALNKDFSVDDTLPELVAKVKRSIASITTYDSAGKELGVGTGFFIANGRIVTAKHVLKNAAKVRIRTSDGVEADIVGVVGTHSTEDITILAVDQNLTLPPALLLAEKLPREGERVVVVGNPLGLDFTVSEGIVSAVRAMGNRSLVQTTAAVSPGSSGSPLVRYDGAVIGVIIFYIEGGQSINFAVPSMYIAEIKQTAPTPFEVMNGNNQSTVLRRGTESELQGRIKNIDDNGVSIQSATGAEMLVTWDHVRKITTNDPNLKSKASEFQDTATALWRARSRLERGDYALAEPLFERLFAQYRGRPNETALIVSEGLLRCRLQRSANDAAVLPALETIRLRRKGVKTSAYQSLSPLFDEATSLCVRLPPAWAPSATLPRVEIDLKTYDAQGDTTVAAIASLYRTAIRQQLGLAAEDVRKLAADQPGVVLLQLLVKGLDPDAGQRAVSRTALEKRLPDLPAWAQAWCRYVIGVSLLAETGVGRHEAALVSLAYIPASYQRDQPYLAALALAMMVLELQRMGESESAAALRSDLIRDFPNHPAQGLLETAPASSAADWNAGTAEYQSMQRLPQKDHA